MANQKEFIQPDYGSRWTFTHTMSVQEAYARARAAGEGVLFVTNGEVVDLNNPGRPRVIGTIIAANPEALKAYNIRLAEIKNPK